ncbi:hypothetical protein [Lonsdalea quercina]|uniref:hypothetical protein n=1 Tax=Lonsdalea quercina TaxID=71657 RepID=UPI0039762797
MAHRCRRARAGSLLLALYSLMLTPLAVSQRGGGTLFNALGGLEGLALSLFKTPRMVVFFIFAMLLGVALPVSNTFSNPFLHDLARNLRYQSGLAVSYPSVLLSLSQVLAVDSCFRASAGPVLEQGEWTRRVSWGRGDGDVSVDDGWRGFPVSPPVASPFERLRTGREATLMLHVPIEL